jgi:hypothetical protein
MAVVAGPVRCGMFVSSSVIGGGVGGVLTALVLPDSPMLRV